MIEFKFKNILNLVVIKNIESKIQNIKYYKMINLR